jgi:hypothetical protein
VIAAAIVIRVMVGSVVTSAALAGTITIPCTVTVATAVIASGAGLAVVDGPVAATLQAVRANVVADAPRTRLAVVNRTIAAALEAICADIVVDTRCTRLAVVNRTVAAALETVGSNVVGRARRGLREGCRSGNRQDRRRGKNCQGFGEFHERLLLGVIRKRTPRSVVLFLGAGAGDLTRQARIAFTRPWSLT